MFNNRGVIDGLVKENKVMLFMKGNKMFPQCGFSNSAVQVRSSLARGTTDDVGTAKRAPWQQFLLDGAK